MVGTAMEILALGWVTQSKNGISEMDLQRRLRVSDYGTWPFRQTLIQAMREQDDGQPPLASVETCTASGLSTRHDPAEKGMDMIRAAFAEQQIRRCTAEAG